MNIMMNISPTDTETSTVTVPEHPTVTLRLHTTDNAPKRAASKGPPPRREPAPENPCALWQKVLAGMLADDGLSHEDKAYLSDIAEGLALLDTADPYYVKDFCTGAATLLIEIVEPLMCNTALPKSAQDAFTRYARNIGKVLALLLGSKGAAEAFIATQTKFLAEMKALPQLQRHIAQVRDEQRLVLHSNFAELYQAFDAGYRNARAELMALNSRRQEHSIEIRHRIEMLTARIGSAEGQLRALAQDISLLAGRVAEQERTYHQLIRETKSLLEELRCSPLN